LTESLSVDGHLSEGIAVEVLEEAINDVKDDAEDASTGVTASGKSLHGLHKGNKERTEAHRSKRSGD